MKLIYLNCGGGSEVLENLTERLTLSWSFQKVAFQKNKSVQLTRRDPLFVHLLRRSQCRCLFFVVQALALRRPGFFHQPTISFLVSRSPFAGQHSHSRSEIQKQQLNTPKILFLHHCTYRNRAIARDERAVRKKCAR